MMIKVMIVEDDPMVAEFNKRYLEEIEGFKLIAMAKTTKDALGYLEKNSIDLILLDIYMPGSNGLEFLTKLRKLNKEIDVIMISAASDKMSIEKALRYGAVDYLIKPFEFDRFKMALTNFREHKIHMIQRESFNQEQLDALIFHNRLAEKVGNQLPKGLTKSTLKNIYETIKDWENRSFTTEQLGYEIGISRVSTRKYLSFLTDLGVLEEEVIYGSVGRPQYEYRCERSKLNVIKSYL